jgi:hypothetical protein
MPGLFSTKNFELSGGVTFRNSTPTYTWNSDRETAVGWDLIGLGLGGLALVAPAAAPVFIAVGVIGLVGSGQKLVLDLLLPDEDQKRIDANWAITQPGGRAGAFIGALIGGDADQVAQSARRGQLIFDVASGVRDFSESGDVFDLFEASLEVYDSEELRPVWEGDLSRSDAWDKGGDLSLDGAGVSSESDYFDDYGVVGVTEFDFDSIVGETNDPTMGAESHDSDYDQDEWDEWEDWDQSEEIGWPEDDPGK